MKLYQLTTTHVSDYGRHHTQHDHTPSKYREDITDQITTSLHHNTDIDPVDARALAKHLPLNAALRIDTSESSYIEYEIRTVIK